MLNMDISKEELEYIAKLFSRYMKEEQYDNSSAYEVRNLGKLESSIVQPFQQIGGQDLYPTLVSKASMLYYFCIKNHPFEDGNKRMAIFALIIYLAKNGYWLETTNEEIFDITVYTAASSMKDKDETVKRIEEFVQDSIVEY
ncbi:MAG: type II toxin-antitoxin system death-on-curing family toxin [Candidatus Dojkabacteria bacterium]